ncbi:MAG: sulfatase-like hydrolase/transferase [Planctomycetales bacterium]|nr:sulfatase-like hydrolase/transferase [Planctomycetales bacterium]
MRPGNLFLVIAVLSSVLWSGIAACAERQRVACLGDSITAGARVEPALAYPAQLQELLGQEFEVRNFGIGGATLIKRGRPNVWSQLAAVKQFAPHQIIISLGTNDTVSGNRKNWEKIDHFRPEYQDLIDSLAQLPTNPKIVLCTPTAMVLETPGLTPQRRADLQERQPRLQQLCNWVRELAQANAEKNVSLLELNPVLAQHPEWLTEKDGVHPNAEGYLAVARAVAGHLRTTARPATSSSPPTRQRPNIVFFLVDDMGWQDTSVPFHTERTPLNDRYRTPNMERLAREGMKFTQAYACALCSPTRVSLMTGMNAARHGVTNWTLRKNQQTDRGHAKVIAGHWNVNGLSPANGIERSVHAVTLPSLLRQAGYRTIHVGKAHFGAQGTPGEDPKNLGFGVNIAGHAAGGPGSYYGKNNFSAAFRRGDRIWDVPGLDKYHGQDVYLNDVLTTEANAQIDAAVADGQPFYLYMAHYAVHAPFEANLKLIKKYQEQGLRGHAAVYASMIESMDESLGAILDRLKQHGIENDTIVVFMSDNGSPRNNPRNLPLRGFKITPYEGGTRVPLIVRWPGRVERGSRCDQYLIIEDVFPTFLEMAGVDGYQQIGGKIDGVSFLPLLKQSGEYPRERPIFWHFPNTYDQPPYSSVRQGDWKLIYQHAEQRLELYNLADDIGETNNLADVHPEIRQRLAKLLADFLRESGAVMTTSKATGKPVPLPAS